MKQLIEDDEAYQRMSQANNPYGDGQASQRICEAIEYYFDCAQTSRMNSYLTSQIIKPLIMKLV